MNQGAQSSHPVLPGLCHNFVKDNKQQGIMSRIFKF